MVALRLLMPSVRVRIPVALFDCEKHFCSNSYDDNDVGEYKMTIFTTLISFIIIMCFYYICIKVYNWMARYAEKKIIKNYNQEYNSIEKNYGDEEMTEETPKNECCQNACGCTSDSGSPKEFELYTDKADEFRWRLRAKNGNIIATSGEGYKNKSDAEHAIQLVKNASNVTIVEDLT